MAPRTVPSIFPVESRRRLFDRDQPLTPSWTPYRDLNPATECFPARRLDLPYTLMTSRGAGMKQHNSGRRMAREFMIGPYRGAPIAFVMAILIVWAMMVVTLIGTIRVILGI